MALGQAGDLGRTGATEPSAPTKDVTETLDQYLARAYPAQPDDEPIDADQPINEAAE